MLFGPLLLMLVAGKWAYEVNAFGERASRLIQYALWAVSICGGFATFLGILGTFKDASSSLLLRILNSRRGLPVVGLSCLAAAVVFAIAAYRTKPPPLWTCSIARTVTGAPDAARCAVGTFATRTTFVIRLRRATDISHEPTLRARAVDRTRSSVALDSDAGGLCAAMGPDQPVHGETRLALTPDCGADRTFVVNLHVCDVVATSAAPRLHAAAQLEIKEGNNGQVIRCE